ncbi:MAG TPA: ATPase domain-containing protein [Candidatus Nanoarchaeia archaeon]|nr:ATPase domain-containing protein [Candidatus Nanoarchaeia archaeon]
MKREGIGIKEIDEMMEGGFPKGSVVGISGPPGVGKSIFALHFLLAGARKGQKGVYVCLEEPRKNIDNMIKGFSFGEEFYDFEKKGLIVIRCFNYSEYEKINLEILEKVYEDKKIQRLVVDSFNCFFDSLECNSEEHFNTNVRKLINSSFQYLREDNLNVLLVLENHESGLMNFDYNIPYLVDGLIKLNYLDIGIIERRIFIPKMRWTSQYKESKGYEITKKGIEVEE